MAKQIKFNEKARGQLKKGVNLGIRKTFADLGQTIAGLFNIEKLKNGKSFLKEIF